MSASGQIQAVCFDVGETIVNETCEYGAWADWLRVPRQTFSAVFGAVIARGQDYRETFQQFRPGFDLALERERRAAAGQPETFGEEDLYPDARPALQQLGKLGLHVSLAGNQTARAGAILRELNLPVRDIWISDTLGTEKPQPAFFEAVVAGIGLPPQEILYVGDRLDNDIRPALDAGLQTALIRRGPWGNILRDEPTESRCLYIIDSLAELPALLGRQA